MADSPCELVHVLPLAASPKVVQDLVQEFRSVAGGTRATPNLGAHRVRGDVPVPPDLRDQLAAAVAAATGRGTTVEFTASAHVYASGPRCGAVTAHMDQPYTLGPVEEPVRPGPGRLGSGSVPAPASTSTSTSTHSLLLYCTACEGGATWLQPPGAAVVRVAPVPCTAVLFPHGVMHGADDVAAGEKVVGVLRVRLQGPGFSGA